MSELNNVQQTLNTLSNNQNNPDTQYVVQGLVNSIPYGNMYINVVDQMPPSSAILPNVIYLVRAND